MSDKLTAEASIKLNASPARVWKALTDPAEIKEYLFGTETKSDWKRGSDITYTGEWEGKAYEDKGKIIDIVPEKLLHTTYYSSMSGKEDKPENYANVIYKLTPDGQQTTLTITQDNNFSEESKEHSQSNWNQVLESLKKLVEK
jgi:uncharacterized protein YndB with AHSA1/START domain